jgi:hypothetical protein
MGAACSKGDRVEEDQELRGKKPKVMNNPSKN